MSPRQAYGGTLFDVRQHHHHHHHHHIPLGGQLPGARRDLCGKGRAGAIAIAIARSRASDDDDDDDDEATMLASAPSFGSAAAYDGRALPGTLGRGGAAGDGDSDAGGGGTSSACADALSLSTAAGEEIDMIMEVACAAASGATMPVTSSPSSSVSAAAARVPPSSSAARRSFSPRSTPMFSFCRESEVDSSRAMAAETTTTTTRTATAAAPRRRAGNLRADESERDGKGGGGHVGVGVGVSSSVVDMCAAAADDCGSVTSWFTFGGGDADSDDDGNGGVAAASNPSDFEMRRRKCQTPVAVAQAGPRSPFSFANVGDASSDSRSGATRRNSEPKGGSSSLGPPSSRRRGHPGAAPTTAGTDAAKEQSWAEWIETNYREIMEGLANFSPGGFLTAAAAAAAAAGEARDEEGPVGDAASSAGVRRGLSSPRGRGSGGGRNGAEKALRADHAVDRATTDGSATAVGKDETVAPDTHLEESHQRMPSPSPSTASAGSHPQTISRIETFYVVPLRKGFASSLSYVEPNSDAGRAGKGKGGGGNLGATVHRRSVSGDPINPRNNDFPRRTLSSPPKWAFTISPSKSGESSVGGSSVAAGAGAVVGAVTRIANRSRSDISKKSQVTTKSTKSGKSGKSNRSGKSNKFSGKNEVEKPNKKTRNKNNGRRLSRSLSPPRSPSSSACRGSEKAPETKLASLPSSPRGQGIEMCPPAMTKSKNSFGVERGECRCGQSAASISSVPLVAGGGARPSLDSSLDLSLPPLPLKCRPAAAAPAPASVVVAAAIPPPPVLVSVPEIPVRDYAALHDSLIDALFNEAKADAATGGGEGGKAGGDTGAARSSSQASPSNKSFRKRQSFGMPPGSPGSDLSHRGLRGSLRNLVGGGHDHGTPKRGGDGNSWATPVRDRPLPVVGNSGVDSSSSLLLIPPSPPTVLSFGPDAAPASASPGSASLGAAQHGSNMTHRLPLTSGGGSGRLSVDERGDFPISSSYERPPLSGASAISIGSSKRRRRGSGVRFGKGVSKPERRGGGGDDEGEGDVFPLSGVAGAASFETVRATNLSGKVPSPSLTKSKSKRVIFGGIGSGSSSRHISRSHRKSLLSSGSTDAHYTPGVALGSSVGSIGSVGTADTPVTASSSSGFMNSVLRLTPIRSVRKLDTSQGGNHRMESTGSVGSLASMTDIGIGSEGWDENGGAVPLPRVGSSAWYLDAACRLQKDSRKGDPVGSAVCVTGREASIKKLREKVDILVEVENGAAGGVASKAQLKRKSAVLVASKGLPDGVVETRCTLGVKMGLLTMKYGVLLWWNVRTGKVELAVLRKMCPENFLSQCPPLTPEALEKIRLAAGGDGSHSEVPSLAAPFPVTAVAPVATALSTPVQGLAKQRSLIVRSTTPGEIGQEMTSSAAAKHRAQSTEDGQNDPLRAMPGDDSSSPTMYRNSLNGTGAALHRRWNSEPSKVPDADEDGGAYGTEVALLGPPYKVARPDIFPPPTLSVTVLRARGLLCCTSRGKSCRINPYVRVSLGEQEHSTRPVKWASNPTWEGRVGSRNSCVFECPVDNYQFGTKDTDPDELHLRVEVLDRRRFGKKDRVLGVVFVPLASLEPQQDHSVADVSGAGDLASDVAGSSMLSGQSDLGVESPTAAATEVTIPCRMIQCEDAPYGCVTLSLIHRNAYECWLKDEIQARKMENGT